MEVMFSDHLKLASPHTRAAQILLCSLLVVVAAPSSTVLAEDVVEFLSGSQLQGTVKSIRKGKREFDFEATIGGRTSLRTFPYSQVHAVTIRGKRYVLNERPDGGAAASSTGSTNHGGAPTSAQPAERIERTREEVQSLIDKTGRTPPDWFESTPLNCPPTLDLTWPDPPEKQWNNQKYVGQYVWEIINPNPGKWREGVRLLHHIVAENKNRPATQKKAMNQLGTLYCSLFEDWPRAAFWWQQAGSGTSGAMGRGGFRVGYEVGLARCYWELGNREMAVEMLNRVRGYSSGAAHLWAELGEHDRALKMAEPQARQQPGAYLVCGDICRHAGRYDEALAYYRKVAGLQDREKFGRAIYEAQDRILGLQAERSLDFGRLRDGVYTASSLAYAALLEVAVTVKDGRIVSVKVTRHEEKQYYSSLTDIPRQIIDKQSIRSVDATSGATITAEAIISASTKALAKGMQ